MMDYFSVDIPVFVPSYDEKKLYGWSRYKDDLWDLLKDTTGGYCMYCYDTVWINGQRRGQIEHGIEKINSPEYLTDCVPNLGLACENCNGKYIPGDCGCSCGYSRKEIEIIEGHIRLFQLNSPERRNREVGRYCKNVIDHHNLMEDMPYHNLVVNLFRNKLQGLSVDNAVKVCKVIYSRALLQRIT